MCVMISSQVVDHPLARFYLDVIMKASRLALILPEVPNVLVFVLIVPRGFRNLSLDTTCSVCASYGCDVRKGTVNDLKGVKPCYSAAMA